MAHRLLQFLLDAAIGRFPAADGGVTVLPTLPNGTAAVVAFTGHAVVATSLTPNQIAGLHLDGYGGSIAPAALLALARGATIGTNDVTLVRRGVGRGGTQLRPVTEWDDHPRVR